MKVVILAGGYGTRMREETEFKPKPMVEVGGHPVLWHIMKNFAHFGITDFIVASGYKNEYIKDYFLNYESRQHDFTVQLGHPGEAIFHGSKNSEDWKVTIADTGDLTLTGERVRVASKYLNPGETFMVGYGDGLADIAALIEVLGKFEPGIQQIGVIRENLPQHRQDGLVAGYQGPEGFEHDNIGPKQNIHQSWRGMSIICRAQYRVTVVVLTLCTYLVQCGFPGPGLPHEAYGCAIRVDDLARLVPAQSR